MSFLRTMFLVQSTFLLLLHLSAVFDKGLLNPGGATSDQLGDRPPNADVIWSSFRQQLCPSTMASQLFVGAQGVVPVDGAPVNLRGVPGTNNSPLRQLPPGTRFSVVAGPECSTFAWWHVRLEDDGSEGWVAEGANGTYYVNVIGGVSSQVQGDFSGSTDFAASTSPIALHEIARVQIPVELDSDSVTVQGFSADGRFLLITYKGDLWLLDVPTLAVIDRYSTEYWIDGAVASDGQSLFTLETIEGAIPSESTEIVQQWDIATHTLTSEYEPCVQTFAWCTRYLLDAQSMRGAMWVGLESREDERITAALTGGGFSNSRASAIPDPSGLVIFDLASGAILNVIDISDMRENAMQDVRNIAFSPDGSRLIAEVTNVGAIWNVASGERVQQFDYRANATLSPDNQILLVNGTRYDGSHYVEVLTLVDLASGQATDIPDYGNVVLTDGLTSTVDATHLVAAYSSFLGEPLRESNHSYLRTWNLETHSVEAELGFAEEIDGGISASPDGKYVVVAFRGGTIRLLEVTTSEDMGSPSPLVQVALDTTFPQEADGVITEVTAVTQTPPPVTIPLALSTAINDQLAQATLGAYPTLEGVIIGAWQKGPEYWALFDLSSFLVEAARATPGTPKSICTLVSAIDVLYPKNGLVEQIDYVCTWGGVAVAAFAEAGLISGGVLASTGAGFLVALIPVLLEPEKYVDPWLDPANEWAWSMPITCLVFPEMPFCGTGQDNPSVAPVLPSGDFGPEAIWQYQAGSEWYVNCIVQDIEQRLFCLEQALAEIGANAEVYRFTAALNGEALMYSFDELGEVDLAQIIYPIRANSNLSLVLINGDPSVVDVEDVWELDIAGNPLYASLVSTNPNVRIFGNSPQFESSEQSPEGGQRFVFAYEIQECNACPVVGHARVAFDFGTNGTYLGKTLLDPVTSGEAAVSQSRSEVEPRQICPNTPLSRFVVGQPGRVTFTDGTPTRLRNGPGTNNAILLEMPEGTEFTVIAGPECATYSWWQIRLADGTVGWSAEGFETTYYLEPVAEQDPSDAARERQSGVALSQTYTSPDGQFTFQYPEGWYVAELSLGHLALYRDLQAFQDYMLLDLIPSGDFAHIDLHIEWGIWGGGDTETVVRGERAGRSTHVWDAQVSGGGTASRFSAGIEFLLGSTRSAITAQGPSDQAESLEATLVDIANSITVSGDYLDRVTDDQFSIEESFVSRMARVNHEINALYAAPGSQSPVLQPLADGTIVEILGGPEMDEEGFPWWQARLPSGEQGWVAEYLPGENFVLTSLPVEIASSLGVVPGGNGQVVQQPPFSCDAATVNVDATYAQDVVEGSVIGSGCDVILEITNPQPYWVNLRMTPVGRGLTLTPSQNTATSLMGFQVIPPGGTVRYHAVFAGDGQTVTALVDNTAAIDEGARQITYAMALVDLASLLTGVDVSLAADVLMEVYPPIRNTLQISPNLVQASVELIAGRPLGFLQAMRHARDEGEIAVLIGTIGDVLPELGEEALEPIEESVFGTGYIRVLLVIYENYSAVFARLTSAPAGFVTFQVAAGAPGSAGGGASDGADSAEIADNTPIEEDLHGIWQADLEGDHVMGIAFYPDDFVAWVLQEGDMRGSYSIDGPNRVRMDVRSPRYGAELELLPGFQESTLHFEFSVTGESLSLTGDFTSGILLTFNRIHTFAGEELTQCADSLTNHIVPGFMAYVSFQESSGLALKTHPSIASAAGSELHAGTPVFVVGGPECEGSHTWWQVQVRDSGQVGWLPEEVDGRQLLEPIPVSNSIGS